MNASEKHYPISTFIICKNEEDRIHYAINSVKDWVDEVIVVDSGSTDSTLEVAKNSGATLIVYNKWQGYGPQKCYAESLCKNDWILNLDADEECSKELKEEIIQLLSSNNLNHSAYLTQVRPLPRLNLTVFKCGPKLYAARFYNKLKAKFKNSIVHDSVILREGSIGKLRGVIHHRPFRSYHHAIEKINYYTTLQAKDLLARNRDPNILRIASEPIWTFFKAYFINMYFIWGVEGLLEALLYSMARTLRLMKAKELFLQKKLTNKYQKISK